MHFSILYIVLYFKYLFSLVGRQTVESKLGRGLVKQHSFNNPLSRSLETSSLWMCPPPCYVSFFSDRQLPPCSILSLPVHLPSSVPWYRSGEARERHKRHLVTHLELATCLEGQLLLAISQLELPFMYQFLHKSL
jgi:hypothetical protein